MKLSIGIYPSGIVFTSNNVNCQETPAAIIGVLSDSVFPQLINQPKGIYPEWIDFVKDHYWIICSLGQFKLTVSELTEKIERLNISKFEKNVNLQTIAQNQGVILTPEIINFAEALIRSCSIEARRSQDWNESMQIQLNIDQCILCEFDLPK